MQDSFKDDVHVDKRLKMRNEWLANTYTREDRQSNTSGSSKGNTARDRFLMDTKNTENENVSSGVSQRSQGIDNPISNLNEASDRCIEPRTSNSIIVSDSPVRITSKMSVKGLVKGGSTLNGKSDVCETKLEGVTCEDIVSKKRNVETSPSFTVIANKNNREHIKSKSLEDHYNGNKIPKSLSVKKQSEDNCPLEKSDTENEKENVIRYNLNDGHVSNGAVVTNGWPEIKGYSVEVTEEKDEYSKSDANINGESCDVKHSVDSLDIKEGTKEKGILETLVKEKKESKVSKFVRMFNKKEANALDGGERSSVRRNQSRVWGMCMQVQSPSLDEEYYKDCAYKKSERDSVKSEPIIDNAYSDLESSLETGLNGSQTSSSFPDAEAASYRSLDIDRENMIGKNKNQSPSLEGESKLSMNLIRSIGGRRSFDKPQRPSNFPKRCNTLEDGGTSVGLPSRSSKTLPATPTSCTPKPTVDSNASHPFYRRFYSHCMILPMKKKKKENSKNLTCVKGPEIIVDTSSLSQNGEDSSRDLCGEGIIDKRSTNVSKQQEPADSPKKIPVIEDLLAEIMENVNIMEQEIQGDEMKRKSIIFSANGHHDSELGGCSNGELSGNNNGISMEMSGDELLDDGAAYDSLETSDWSGAPSSSQSPTPMDGMKLTRSSSRVSSLICRFEQGTLN